VIGVKKLGITPTVVAGASEAAATPHDLTPSATGYLHTVLDDRSRLAYTEILADEKGATTAAFWTRAHDWFASCGIVIARCSSDNVSNYRSRDFAALAATGRRSHRPQGDPALSPAAQRQG
jgi:hypothetical protein